jgi:hypothetical protein
MNRIKHTTSKPQAVEKSLSSAIHKAWFMPVLFLGLGLAGAVQAATPSWTYLGTSGASGKPYAANGRPYALIPANGPPNTLTNMLSPSTKAELLEKIAQRLPEGQPIGQNEDALAMLTDDQGANLFLSKAARVKVSYVSEGAGYRNSLGFFKFTTAALASVAKPSDDKIMFPDYSSNVLLYGDTVDLGQFAAGDALGFTIAANGWRNSPAPGNVSSSQAESMIYRTIKRFNPEPDINNQRAHTILFKWEQKKMLVLAMEDLNRSNCTPRTAGCNSDDDFNDVILAVHVDPWDAVQCLNGQCDQLECGTQISTTPIPTSALKNNGSKVNICHFPPGNPENYQSITISVNALGTHLSHHNDVFAVNGVCPPIAAGICNTPPSCTSPQVLENGICVTPPPSCTSPQVLENGVCVTPPPTCTSPQVLENGVCVTPPPTCILPQVLQNGVCVTPLSGKSGPISWREITAPPAVVDNNKATKASAKAARDAAKAAKELCLEQEKIQNTGRDCNNL